MALTTRQSQQIRENVSDDTAVPVVTRPRRSLSPEALILLDKSIVAKPLSHPEVAEIRIKNTDYYYRWVNKDSGGGLMYSRWKAMGFVNATPDDVELKSGNAAQDGAELRAGDLVLMKLPYHKWAQHMKYNHERANFLSRARGVYYSQTPSTDPLSESSPSRVTVNSEPYNRAGMTSAFIPTDQEVNAMVEDSTRSGRADAARKQMEEFRKEHGGK
jgi:hypothetical protein